MDIPGLLSLLGIKFISEGNKHCTTGWVNTHCPFCDGSKNYHLGVPLDGKISKCWRCGKHSLPSTLAALSKKPISEIFQLLKKYQGSTGRIVPRVQIGSKKFEYPSGIGPLMETHKKYLEKRRFDCSFLEKVWGIKGVGPMGKLGMSDYKNRILAPIIWEGEVVSFQARTIKEGLEPKYKACPKEIEKKHHQHILYVHPKFKADKNMIITEGITDVWRLGFQAVAVFGIEYTKQQVREIYKIKKNQPGKTIILFDDDPQAIVQGEKLMADLMFRGLDVAQKIIVGDPGGMDQEEAEKLMDSLL